MPEHPGIEISEQRSRATTMIQKNYLVVSDQQRTILCSLLLALGTSVKQLGQFDNVYFPLAVSFYSRVFSL